MLELVLILHYLCQSESGGVGLQLTELVPFLLCHMLGDQTVRGLDGGEFRLERKGWKVNGHICFKNLVCKVKPHNVVLKKHPSA